jgi:hypothetical protein
MLFPMERLLDELDGLVPELRKIVAILGGKN